ncbi:ankyrin repeat domain-containing protein [Profundibacter amoris]|uniref:Ankyrin repeat domain-containing protein n=1 Tax=Profundibacter amoris TaxID=2171755 RepID=A0A347UG42_9RHOB|nr:ankyrin repeat domain-containing protein [Profundibacter amoris]AXX97820.1 ankyrin repeat domain-containing protein [Profundibacter amoris]
MKKPHKHMNFDDDNSNGGFSDLNIFRCIMNNDIQGVDACLTLESREINRSHPETGITPLMLAAGQNLEFMVSHLLLKNHVDLFVKDVFGRSALDHARLNPRIVKLLLDGKTRRRNPSFPGSNLN